MLISEFITINLAKPQRRKLRVPSTPIADPLRHERVIRKLTKRLTRKANLPRATQADIHAAVERSETNQKRVDLEFEKQAKLAQLRHDAHRR